MRAPRTAKVQPPSAEQRSLIEYLNHCAVTRQNPVEAALINSTIRACLRRGWITLQVTPAGTAAVLNLAPSGERV